MDVATVIHQKPLNDVEVDFIDEILSRFQHQQHNGMTLEGMDGFFAALICGPEPIDPMQCLPVLLGEEAVSDDNFINSQEFQIFLEYLMRHWHATEERLAAGKLFFPLLYVDQDDLPLGNDWATGFLYGTGFCEDLRWDEFMKDHEYEEIISPILSLAMESNPNPALRPFNKPIGPRKRKRLPTVLSHSVTLIYSYFGPYRHKKPIKSKLFKSCPHTFRKLESSDLCPCGSRFTYRQCCGIKQTLH